MSPRLALCLIIALGILCTPAAASNLRYWRLCAQAPLIVSGTVTLPPAAQRHGYYPIKVKVDRVLKGHIASNDITFLQYAEERNYDVTPARLAEVNGRRAILFLVQTEDANDHPALYVAGRPPHNLELATDDILAAVAAEIARQDRVVRDWHRPLSDRDHIVVKSMIDRLTQPDNEDFAIRSLQLRAKDDPMPIIDLVDDRRALPPGNVEFENPRGWEPIVHYGPQKVVDALDVIVGIATDESFGEISNGGGDAERDRVVAAWRVYTDIRLHHPEALRNGY